MNLEDRIIEEIIDRRRGHVFSCEGRGGYTAASNGGLSAPAPLHAPVAQLDRASPS